MRYVAAALVVLALIADPAGAQGRGRRGGREVPPGHLPPSGQCRVWYDGRPPGQQPRPTDCREAERIASGDRSARVIYGGIRQARSDNRRRDRDNTRRDRDDNRRDRDDDHGDRDRDDGRWERDDDRRDRNRPRVGQWPLPDRTPNRRGSISSVPFDNGYGDGYDKGREDARDSDSYDPVRHSRYRSADRGYDRRYGSKDQYKRVYREGFTEGYENGYRDADRRGSQRRGGIQLPRLPWPF